MKRLKIPAFVAVIIYSATIYAQTPMITSGAELNSFMKSDLSYLEEQEARYSKVEGSPYMDESFKPGALVYKNKLFTNLQLRYNYYEGYFEFKTDDEVKYYDPRYIEVDTVWLESAKYIYVEYDNGRNIKRDYMKILRDGHAKALAYQEIIMLEPEEASGYNAARPARFDPRPEVYYVQVGDDPALQFKNRRSIEEVFPDHIKALEKYAKAEKLRFRDSEEVAELVKYYNTLE